MLLNENLFLEYTEDTETEYAHSNGWKKVDSKEVKDSDGFMTEYTWYTNDAEDTHIFILGDSDIYGPDDSYADAEFDSYDLAKEWFDNYYGYDYDEEDLDWVEFAEDRPAIEESISNNIDIEWFSLSSDDLKDFGINPINTYEQPTYYCVDTGFNQQVVVAQSSDGKIVVEEDTDGLGFTEGAEYESEEAFLAEYKKRINGQLEEAIEPNIESEELKELAQKHNIKILDAMSDGDLRLEGTGADLMKFYQEAEQLGLWQVDPSLYECDNTVNETLTMHNFDEFKAIADEVGLVTARDLETFRREEVQPGESELDAIKRYKQELIDAGVDLSKLVNEGVMSELDQDSQDAAFNEESLEDILKSKLIPLKKELQYLQDYAKREVGKGGAFDSTEDLEEAITEVEKEISNVESKLKVLMK